MNSRGDVLSLTLTAVLFMVILGVYIGAKAIINSGVKALITSNTILDKLLKVYSKISSKSLVTFNRYSFILIGSLNSTCSNLTIPILTFSNSSLNTVFIGLGD